MIVVADGLGSTGHGAEASGVALQVVAGELPERLRGGATLEEVGEALRARYEQLVDGNPRMATTCLFAAASSTRIVVGQVGDGWAAVLLEDGHLVTFETGRGDFANETDALPQMAPKLRAFHPPSVRAVLLATDGVADDLAPDGLSDFVTGWADLMRTDAARAALVLERFLRDWRTPNSNDDRALALLVRREEN